VDTKELEELIRIFEASSLSEIEVEEDGRRMRLQKPQPIQPSFAPYPYPGPPLEQSGSAVAAAPPSPAPGSAPSAEPEPEEALPTIDSPMVGTFYAAPAPGEDPFVKVGDAVEEGQTVCIVEAMKLMNEVGAKSACKIVKVLVENGEPVEFGQPLFAIDPT
jgi:acetyl-CoA carboxylase biotin carboxyl carrier protein